MHPLRNVVCATDLNDPAPEELRQAAAIAAGDGARLMVVHILIPPTSFATTGVDVAAPLLDEGALLAEARQALDRRLAERPDTAAAGREVIRGGGSVASEVLRRAQALRADLLVVGSHRRSGLTRLLLGSTAQEIVHHASIPVLVARPGPVAGAVVAATDLSAHSAPAVRAAAEEARRRHADLVVVHALDLPSPAVGLGGAAVVPAPPDDPSSHEVQRRAAEDRLRTFLQQAEVTGQAVVAEGDPVASVIAYAERSAALVVVGTSSKSGLERAFLGSVAMAVVRKSPCSVLTVPGPRTT